VVTEQLKPFIVNERGPVTKLWPALTADTSARASGQETPVAVMPEATSPPGPPPGSWPQLALAVVVDDDAVLEGGRVVELTVEAVEERGAVVLDVGLLEVGAALDEDVAAAVVPGARVVCTADPRGAVVAGTAAFGLSSPPEQPTAATAAAPMITNRETRLITQLLSADGAR
jgi:hypothetical protein